MLHKSCCRALWSFTNRSGSKLIVCDFVQTLSAQNQLCLHHKLKLQRLTMSAKNLHILSLLEKLFTSLQQQQFIKNCNIEYLKFCCECAVNIINGTVPVNLNELKFHKQQIKQLCKRSTSNQKRRKILMSKKGLKLLNLISRPCFCYLTN